MPHSQNDCSALTIPVAEVSSLAVAVIVISFSPISKLPVVVIVTLTFCVAPAVKEEILEGKIVTSKSPEAVN